MDIEEYQRMADVEDRHWWWLGRREIAATAIERYTSSRVGVEGNVLEVGCGTGGNLEMLSRFGRVLGAEREARAIESLRRKYGDRYSVVQHAIPDPLPGRFDVLAMFDVLEHVDDDAGALEWVATHLAPGGIAVITVPAFKILWSELDDAVHHRRRYTPRQLLDIVPASLQVAHITCYNTFLYPIVLGARLAMRALPKRARPGGAQLNVPPRPINWFCYHLFRSERHLAPGVRMPVGVSILLVLRRPFDSA